MTVSGEAHLSSTLDIGNFLNDIVLIGQIISDDVN